MTETRVTDADIERAGRQIVRSTLCLGRGDGLVVIGDEPSRRMTEAVALAAEAAGVRVFRVWLEELGRRPLVAIPDAVDRRLNKAGASAFLASAPHQEMRMRQHLLGIVASHGVRHAHMEGISELAFVRGLQGDYREISRIGRSMMKILEKAEMLRCDSRSGTMLSVDVGKTPGWFAELGEVAPGTWCPLPSGALYCAPDHVDGVFVANASLGEFFGRRAGLLADNPVRLEIEDRRVVSVDTHSRALQRDIEETLSFGANSDLVGLVSIGVNIGMTDATGEAHTDQNLPGLHLVIGDPASKITGASFEARTSFAACQADASLRIDDHLAIHEGVMVLA